MERLVGFRELETGFRRGRVAPEPGTFGMHRIGQSSQSTDLFVSVDTGLAAGVPAPGVGEHDR